MSWINTIKYEDAEGGLKKIYDRIKGPSGHIDNVLTIHSLRPHTLVGHMTLYKSVLHNSNNTLPKWYLEALGTYVSFLNKCDYCFEHHYTGFRKLIVDPEKADFFKSCVTEDKLDHYFKGKLLLGCEYGRRLTMDLPSIDSEFIDSLSAAGFTDGEILEINQVCSYFNYVNRTVVGLGVNTDKETLGLSPNNSSDSSDWSHL